MRTAALVLIAVGALSGCSIVTVKQKPFEPTTIKAARPKAPPPRVVLLPSRIQIMEKIQFEFDSADIKPESHGLLNEIVDVLKDNPQIEVVQIEGHTDAQGAAAYNKKLSKERAESVAKYIADHGIDAGRLSPKGFGLEKLITDGDTEADHEINRRVEFNIIKQGKKKVVIKEED